MAEFRDLYREHAAGAVVAAVPSVGLVVTNAASTLHPAIAVAAGLAIAGFGWELARHRRLWHALAGLVIVGGCAGVAAGTGQARGFFLLPMLVPVSVVVAGLVTLAIGKPLTGLLLNRISGGPADSTQHPRLYRMYVVTTVASTAFQVINALV